ncbi:MAG: O-antigen ligase family protein [bacterium]
MSTPTKLPSTRDAGTSGGLAMWLERGIIGCLVLFAAAAPHSIAATQIAWLLGLTLWALRFAIYPRPQLRRTPVDYPLIGFFIFTGLSSFFSYEPLVSIGKLRAASLFTIVYLVAQNVPSRRVIRLLVLTLVGSCMVNVLFTVGQRALGRGVKIQHVAMESPLSAAVFRKKTIGRAAARHLPGEAVPTPIIDGDTILEVDGKTVRDPSELSTALAASSDTTPALVKIYRVEWSPVLEVPRGRLLAGPTAEAQLGVNGWSLGRDWRASGFFGHYVTYAEALQLILALAVGLFVSLPRKRSWAGISLLIAVAGLATALLLTVTRASWLAALLSSGLILILGTKRKTLLIAGALAIPLVLAGLFVLQQKRNISFFDRQDQSTTWRETVWREGTTLLFSKPRHLLVGVGMDSIKRRQAEWGLFDHGRLPAGHMHSNLLQLALERGIPALLAWLLLLGVYARMLWQLARRPLLDDWIERGVILGALGGLCGFFASGLAHYNWGDSEVVMIFYFIMGLALAVHSESARVKEKAR